MSRCFYVKEDKFVNLEALKENIQELMNEGLTVKLDKYDFSEGEGGCLYIDGEAARGVHVYKEDKNIVVKLNILCNYADYVVAQIILGILKQIFEKDIFDDENKVIHLKKYFTDEKIQEFQESDAKMVLLSLKEIMKDSMEIFGAVRKIYFGTDIRNVLLKYEDDPKKLVNILNSIIHHVQYELPDYNMPGAALIRPKDSDDEKDFKKIRMIFEGNNYILQDYDFLLIHVKKPEEESILIDNKDLIDICSKIFKKSSGFELADDFTVVFPKLEGKNWEKFVDLARKKNHKEMLESVPAAETVNLTPDYDPESKEEEDDYQYHGNHWDCILEDPKNEINNAISESLEKSSLYGKTECDYNLDEKLHAEVAMLEYDKGDSDSSIVVRNIIAPDKDNKNTFVSGYPVVRGGNLFTLKIIEITEWDNGLEAWITAELNDGRNFTFFDADYSINKDKYETGKSYDFIIGALAYSAEEPESKGFKFEGQQAIDFKAKMGEEPEYDENGNVKPIEFSTANLCAFLQGIRAPDEVEYISTVENIKTVKAFGNSFWKFDVIYRSEDEDNVKVPIFVLQSKDNTELSKATQIQGILWLTGYLVK